jgi:hypothetical protein
MKKLILLIGVFGIFAAGYAMAQVGKQKEAIGPSPSADAKSIAGMFTKLGSTLTIRKMAINQGDTAESVVALENKLHAFEINVFNRTVADKNVAAEAVYEILNDFNVKAVDATSATQASQLASEAALKLQSLQVAQNARTIELLEKIATKK